LKFIPHIPATNPKGIKMVAIDEVIVPHSAGLSVLLI
jgi:hypothetical protein